MDHARQHQQQQQQDDHHNSSHRRSSSNSSLSSTNTLIERLDGAGAAVLQQQIHMQQQQQILADSAYRLLPGGASSEDPSYYHPTAAATAQPSASGHRRSSPAVTAAPTAPYQQRITPPPISSGSSSLSLSAMSDTTAAVGGLSPNVAHQRGTGTVFGNGGKDKLYDVDKVYAAGKPYDADKVYAAGKPYDADKVYAADRPYDADKLYVADKPYHYGTNYGTSARPSSASSKSTAIHTLLSGGGGGRIGRYVKCMFLVYIATALVYTVSQLYGTVSSSSREDPDRHSTSTMIHATTSSAGESRVVVSVGGDGTSVRIGDGVDASETAAAATAPTIAIAPADTDAWTSRFILRTPGGSTIASDHPLLSATDDLLYSKLFQYALKPTRIIPYYYAMTDRDLDPKDITVTTLITIERLQVFNSLVNKYRGPISVTLHLEDDDQVEAALEQLHAVRRSNPLFAKHVDLHLIVDRYDRQFNLWRNVARFFARTHLIMTTDVDFMLCSDLRANYAALGEQYRAMVEQGQAVMVVPAFEYGREAAELDVEAYPSTKPKLLEQVKQNDLLMFHNKWKRGHGPTQYEKWYEATEPYQVVDYNYNYEPYILMKREGHPWCDERFVGYGSNKAACLYEIYLSGAEFWVLPNDFLIHQRHPYPENDRRVERKYNKRLYDVYREETCFRYSRMGAGVPNATAVDEHICGTSTTNYFGL